MGGYNITPLGAQSFASEAKLKKSPEKRPAKAEPRLPAWLLLLFTGLAFTWGHWLAVKYAEVKQSRLDPSAPGW